MPDPDTLVVLACEAGAARVGQRCADAASYRRDGVVATFADARARLEPAGFWVRAPVIVLDAPLGGLVALTLPDAAAEGLTAHAGRPAILFAPGVETHLDLVLHELVHVWLRARGADDARLRMDANRVVHESAVVHEGVADFVAAALTRDPVIGEASLRITPTSLRVVATCPNGLTGASHHDALVVSGALWELASLSPTALSHTLAAVRQSAVPGSASVAAFVDHMTKALAGTPLAPPWSTLVDARGLRHCAAPIVLDLPRRPEGLPSASRFSARAGDLLAVGTTRFPGQSQVSGPLHFEAPVTGTKVLQIAARTSQPDALAIAWRARDGSSQVVASGVTPLLGWPSSHATLTLPASDTLHFGLVSSAAADLTFNDLTLTALEVHPAPAPPRSSCALATPLDLLPFVVALVVFRTRPVSARRSPPAAPSSTARGQPPPPPKATARRSPPGRGAR